MTTLKYGHRPKQTNPLMGIGYMILCALFGFAMFKLGTGVHPVFFIEKLLAAIFFVVAGVVWAIGVIVFWELFKYFRNN